MAMMMNRLYAALPTMVLGPRSPASNLFPQISMMDSKISGAEEPRAMRVKLETVSFQIRTLTTVVCPLGFLMTISPFLGGDDLDGGHEAVGDDGDAQKHVYHGRHVHSRTCGLIPRAKVPLRSPHGQKKSLFAWRCFGGTVPSLAIRLCLSAGQQVKENQHRKRQQSEALNGQASP
ncbi:hypothetical protein C0Q70_13781 [Pomacea canaliculata]|uniref:Uncharacterized protein n=1 Tax=Pomacea canaliculata TaxID=400727 RepID=A0A2T7NYA0_POMCA|nr:hypothetical protein C0Q70_13781 [Pomacea canaliculata]